MCTHDHTRFEFLVIDKKNEGHFQVCLIDNQNRDEIGCVSVVQVKMKIGKTIVDAWETHSRIYDPGHRRMGFGTCMYVAAIKHAKLHNRQVVSSTNPSDVAQRVWMSKTLNNAFKISRVCKRWWVV